MYFINPFKALRPSKENASSVAITSTDHLSVKSVSDDVVQILCLKLKQITNRIFAEIRVGMKSLDLDAVKDILRIEVRKQIKHNEHFALGTNVFDNVSTALLPILDIVISLHPLL